MTLIWGAAGRHRWPAGVLASWGQREAKKSITNKIQIRK